MGRRTLLDHLPISNAIGAAIQSARLKMSAA